MISWRCLFNTTGKAVQGGAAQTDLDPAQTPGELPRGA